MIIIRSPLRVSFFGGGTDYPHYFNNYESNIISTTINKYVYISINKKFSGDIRLNYSKNELVSSSSEIKHDLIREAFLNFGIDKGIELSSMADIPSSGSGLGSSSAYSVALVKGISEYLGIKLSKHEVFNKSINIEQKVYDLNMMKRNLPIGTSIGIQDTIASSYGGFNHYSFSQNSFSVKKISIDNDNLNTLQSNLLLVYTGLSRVNHQTVNNFIADIDLNKSYLKNINDLSKEMVNNLKNFNSKNFAHFLDESWKIKKSIGGISNDLIDSIYNQAKKLGADGGKLLGAGLGGFLLLYADKEKHDHIMKKLDLKITKFKFETDGCTTIYKD
jgi:D-glycero-alpha-D-manno-heptose-7-phosphate kinase